MQIPSGKARRASYMNDELRAPAKRDGLFLLGMAGIHRSSTLDRAEPAEKQQVSAVFLNQKAIFVQEFLLDRVVFCQSRPPFCRIAGRSR